MARFPRGSTGLMQIKTWEFCAIFFPCNHIPQSFQSYLMRISVKGPLKITSWECPITPSQGMTGWYCNTFDPFTSNPSVWSPAIFVGDPFNVLLRTYYASCILHNCDWAPMPFMLPPKPYEVRDLRTSDSFDSRSGWTSPMTDPWDVSGIFTYMNGWFWWVFIAEFCR